MWKITLFLTLFSALNAEELDKGQIVTQKLLIPNELMPNISSVLRLERYSNDGFTAATNGQFPFVARLVLSREADSYFCTGSLISNRFVLSLKSCVEKYNQSVKIIFCTLILVIFYFYSQNVIQIEVGLGSVDSESPCMIRIFGDLTMYQTNYWQSPLLVRLASPVTYSQYIGAVSLPKGPQDYRWPNLRMMFWRNNHRTLDFAQLGNTAYFDSRSGGFYTEGGYPLSWTECESGDQGAPIMMDGDAPAGVLGGINYNCEPLGVDQYNHYIAIDVKRHLDFINFALSTVVA